jgi:hypothetical protein
MDGRKNNGGHENSGRKSKAEEQKLIENLTPMNPDALKQLQKAVSKGDQWAIKLFFEYFYGKPQQRLDVTSGDEQINIPIIKFFDTK